MSKVQPWVFTVKCNEAQAVDSDVMGEGSGVTPAITQPKSEKVINYKTMLQEYIQSDSRKTVHYETINMRGLCNKPAFEVVVVLDSITLGRGKTF